MTLRVASLTMQSAPRESGERAAPGVRSRLVRLPKVSRERTFARMPGKDRTMLKIFRINDVDKFMEKVNDCQGEVNLHLPDGSVCDLKKDRTAVQLLELLHPEDCELDISLSDPRDCIPLLRYMMCAA